MVLLPASPPQKGGEKMLIWTFTSHPQNISHIARTAAGFGHACYAFGFDKHLFKKAKLPSGGAYPVREPSVEALRSLRDQGYLVVAMQEGGAHPAEIPWTEQMVLLVGRESDGIPEDYQPLVSLSTWIPMHSFLPCFNASDAAVIVMYEADKHLRRETNHV
jgi:tRNA G18 (ribose-2'-O)-methylase SpoU